MFSFPHNLRDKSERDEMVAMKKVETKNDPVWNKDRQDNIAVLMTIPLSISLTLATLYVR